MKKVHESYNNGFSKLLTLMKYFLSLSTLEINPPSTSKTKLNHNAYERDRRRKLNSLFSSLQSLLPGIDQKNKMSVPTTISRILKYIPELQKHVEGLRRLKEEMVMKISRRGDRAPGIEKNNYSAVTREEDVMIGAEILREKLINGLTLSFKKRERNLEEKLRVHSRDTLMLTQRDTGEKRLKHSDAHFRTGCS
ncbi:hypothetical protein QJS10_CPB11g01563 [Acorus calamus]|uniref:Protein IRON-RELATED TRANSCRIPTION FACTOR 2 n=1 Tax=Acorus calamus TaxID=4465 RepID=A0AAV9DR34_ACOCL|nr:hypothetical protein QJS10_CPB11g01563 [Acorus calamus]